MPETRHPADHLAGTLSPADVFDRLVHGVGAKRWDELPALYAERTHVVHPMDPGRAPALTTRAKLDRHFRRGAEILGEVRFEPAAITVHETADPEVIVVEYELVGTHTVTGTTASAPFIGVLRARDGRLVHWREYQHTLAIAQAVGAAG